MQFDDLSYQVIGLAIQVHKTLGPGLLESAYQSCRAVEMTKAGIRYEKEKNIDIIYRENHIDSAFRADFVVENKLVIETKCVSVISDIHIAQLLTYLKLTHIPVGLLLNFQVKRMRDGIKRYVL